jgi:hypothetical protein
VIRLRPISRPPGADNRARINAAVALWRRTTADHGRPGSARIAGLRADGGRRYQRHDGAEHHGSLYRDFGTTAELRDGLHGQENLVISPPAELVEGSRVKVAKPASPQQDTGKQTAGR